MPFIASILFAISASLDAFIVGISYGIKKVHITFLQNMIISLITLAGTILSITIGRHLAPLLPLRTAEIAGSTILSLLGLYYIIKFMRCNLKKYLPDGHIATDEIRGASMEEKKQSSALSLRETALLGLALSVNNIGIGIGASIAGLSLFSAAVITLLFSICFLFLGNYIGKAKILHIADKYADLISGLLLIGLGVYELLI